MEPPCGDHIGGTKRSDGNRKRRFSDEQVRSLECMFEAQTTLEPRRKAQLAGELGLHPRQVAVWFQNRRARWKSKQLEREYDALRADYGALLSSFESLRKEKQSLSAQLHKLAQSLEKHLEESSDSGNCGVGNSTEETKPSWLPIEESVDEKLVDNCWDEGELIGQQEATCLGVSGPINNPLEPAERRCCFTAGSCSAGQSCTPSDWWELWPLNE